MSGKTYSVNSVFYTVQGEGLNAGRAAVFLRLAGCNMWNGTEGGRAGGQGACAVWCDTNFLPREKLTASEIADRVRTLMNGRTAPLVVVTGGEPLLQLDQELVTKLRTVAWSIAVETNGTQDLTAFVDLLTISPKLGRAGQPPAIGLTHEGRKRATVVELKVVLPDPEDQTVAQWSEWLLCEMWRAITPSASWVQPLDPVALDESTASVRQEGARRACLLWVMNNPEWRVGIQLHKVLGAP